MEDTSITLIADYAHAHPRVISLSNELQKLGYSANYLVFATDFKTVEAEKSIFTYSKLCLLGQSQFDKLQRYIPSRLMKYGWPIFSTTLLEILKIPYVIKTLFLNKNKMGNILFISYSPLSVLLGGVIVGRLCKKSIIVDWRDLYLNNHNIKLNVFRKIMRFCIFKFIDFTADCHFTVSEGLKDNLVKVTKKPVHILKNGSNRLGNITISSDPQIISIKYFGSIYYGKQPLADFMKHLEALPLVQKENIQLIFYGTNKKLVKRVISDIGGLSVDVTVKPRLNYASFLKEIHHSGINLVLGWIGDPHDKFGGGVLPTKFWECYSSNTSLLVYAPSKNDELRLNCSELNVSYVSDTDGILEFLNGKDTQAAAVEKTDVSFNLRAKQFLSLVNEMKDVN